MITGAATGTAAAVGSPGPTAAGRREQTRALYPARQGQIERDGVKIGWEQYGAGEPTVLMLPTYSIIHSRFWKPQIPYLARHCTVLTFDGRGNGRSDRPVGAQAYRAEEFAADALAVMDDTGTERCKLLALSCGAHWATLLAADHPQRIDAVAYIAPAAPLAPGHPERQVYGFDESLDVTEGWAKYNSHYFAADYEGFLTFFMAACLNDPHSTKQIEDTIGWALDTTPEALADATRGLGLGDSRQFAERCSRVRCPTLVIHGDADRIRPHAQGAALAQATRGRLVTLAGAGHLPGARDPVAVNLLLRDFLCPPPPPARWTRAPSRTRRALFISSPIGLGHARRDVAVADELRRLHPDLQIDWLAQDPVTRVLEAHRERIHPASAQLASESDHIQSEHREHELHVFQALRRMDEILLSNFMVFSDLVREDPYDLWIGDEAWELDYFLHENPQLKSAAYAWLSDFVGWLPMPDGGEPEAALTADYNAEMLEQLARYPRVRDRSIFVGDPADVVPSRFGPGLPGIRPWTEDHFSFCDYITGFEPSALADRRALRAELGWRSDEPVCIASVGGSGVGAPLLRRVIAAFPEARRRVPGLRLIVVSGPRIAPEALPATDGVQVLPYVHDLHRYLAACDLAIVQGGLATTMELTALRRPFIYVPLKQHFEQNLHVDHRLRRHRAGRRMEYDETTPEALAASIVAELHREVDYRPVPGDGARRAAAIIADLL